MERRANVFIACSPSARVGTSTTARLLTDYFLFTNGEPLGYDTDPHEPRYAPYFPNEAQILDAGDIKGQIALFDGLLASDNRPKIVDVWHRAFPRFFEVVQEIGFFEEAFSHGIEPILLYHADASRTSLESALAMRELWPNLTMMLVRNEGANPLEPHELEIFNSHPAQGKFVITPLPAPVARILSDPTLSLSAFLRSPPPEMSIVVRAALKAWISPIFAQFQSFELRRRLESSDYL
jgi:hypothetical protein